MIEKPCSLRALARHLGLAPSTVSMALKGHPAVAATTRERVAAAAEELGYRPNAPLSALMSRRRALDTGRGTPVALIVDVPAPWRDALLRHDVYRRVCEAEAARYGFSIQSFNLADYKDPAALDRILYARGYRAILLGYWIGERPRVLEMKLERYAVVGLGDLACDLPMLSIRVNIVESIRLLWSRLRAVDARRVLFAVRLEPQPGRKDYEMVGAVKALQVLDPPPWELELHIGRQDEGEGELFRDAVETFKPDLCVGYNRFHHDELCRMGRVIPDDLRYAQLHVAAHHGYRPDGIRAPHEATARRALAAVDRLLRAGALGIDPAMGEVLLEPEWVDGRTLGGV